MLSVAYPGEGPEGPKKIFLRPPPPFLRFSVTEPPLIWRSGPATDYGVSVVYKESFWSVNTPSYGWTPSDLFVCFCFVTGHAPRLPCPRGRSCTIDTPWQTHSSFKAKVKADIISPLFTISPESHPSVNQQFSSLCYSELLDNINFYLSQL